MNTSNFNSYPNEVYELQSKLRKIAQINGNMSIIIADGIFGPDTEEAVREFQVIYGLPPTGTVDYDTWNKVMEEYGDAIYKISPGIAIFPFPSADYVTHLGEKSDIIYIIQILLSAVAVVYDDFENIVPSGTYDRETSDAVRRFQGLNRLPQTGMVDKRTWDSLAQNYNTFAGNKSYTG